jgi:hypothetical protein
MNYRKRHDLDARPILLEIDQRADIGCDSPSDFTARRRKCWIFVTAA